MPPIIARAHGSSSAFRGDGLRNPGRELVDESQAVPYISEVIPMLHLALETALESALRLGMLLGAPAAFFGGGLAFLLAAGEIARRCRMPLHVHLAALFALLGCLQFLHALHYADFLAPLTFLYWWDLPLVYLLGPLAYRTASLVLDSEGNHRPILPHLLPVPLVIALLTPYFRETVNVKTMLYGRGLAFGALPGEEPLLFAVSAGAALSLIIYFVLIAFRLRELRGNVLSSRDRGLTYIFIACAVIQIVFGSLGRLVDGRFMAWSSFEITLILCIMYVVERRHPEYPERLRKAYQGARYRKTRLAGMSLERLETRLKHLMEGENLYRREDLTLADTARALEITPHQLSEFLNHRLDKSFSSLVNEYRVAEARRMLARDPRRTVLSIAYEVGFNNRASFNAAFLKFTGKTPVEYRREAARQGAAAS